MIALIQRVSSAYVDIDNITVGSIGRGLLAFVGVQPNDGDPQTRQMLERFLHYRIFADQNGKMNRSLTNTDGGLLLVSQFTLAADTRHGLRPSFTNAAAPPEAQHWFEYMVQLAQAKHPKVEAGRFGANMQVHLINDGPATFCLEVN